jgi:tRNA isopentenyl-2-thiomethyl-A-37 hydroxylase MiaE
MIDPLLRVRYGSVIGQWVIDRKAVMREDEVYYLARRAERAKKIALRPDATEATKEQAKGIMEEYLSARDGRRIIFFATKLDDNTYNSICASDMRQYGGYSRLAEEIEKQESRQEADKLRVESNENVALWKETYDQLGFLQRKKQDKLLQGERDLKKLLHG